MSLVRHIAAAALLAPALALLPAPAAGQDAGAAPGMATGVAQGAPVRAPLPADDAVLEHIAFGSCLHQDRPQAILDVITAQAPELFLFVGDNVYGDVRDLGDERLPELRDAYARQAASRRLNRLRATSPILATWDDHDYGLNDAGADFPHGDHARWLFADFWELDEGAFPDPEGIFSAHTFGPAGRRVQVILLDTRRFRSPLKPTDDRGAPGRERYLPDPDPAKTMLGERQWAWLEQTLREPADVRLLVTSIQLLAEGHGWEAWHTLPAQREAMFEVLRDSGAEGVVVLSGDRHRAGIYRRDDVLPYPLLEITSSSLNMPVMNATEEAGPRRLGGSFTGTNFGRVDIDWDAGTLELSVVDGAGYPVRVQRVALEELTAAR